MDINMTLLGQTVTFIVFVWFCYKFIWPFLIEAMRERQKTIAEGLAAGEEAERSRESAREEVADRLKEAQAEAQRIVDQARSQAAQMIEQARQDARRRLVDQGVVDLLRRPNLGEDPHRMIGQLLG